MCNITCILYLVQYFNVGIHAVYDREMDSVTNITPSRNNITTSSELLYMCAYQRIL